MFRSAIVVMSLLMAVSSADALNRYNSTGMSCARLTAAVENDGRAVITYPSSTVRGLPLTGTYVASAQFCGVGQDTITRRVPADDTPSCPLRQCLQRTKGSR